MLSSPYTWAQFLKVVVHFFVASKVERNRAFNNALSLGNTLLWRLSFLYVEFKLSMALVVYITFRTVSENLKIGDITSQWEKTNRSHIYRGCFFTCCLSSCPQQFSGRGDFSDVERNIFLDLSCFCCFSASNFLLGANFCHTVCYFPASLLLLSKNNGFHDTPLSIWPGRIIMPATFLILYIFI